jgi:hypothetical protein
MAKSQLDEEGTEVNAGEAEDEEDDEVPRISIRIKKPTRRVSLYEPMFVWIALILIALALKLVATNPNLIPGSSQIYTIANLYSNFMLKMPGTAVLPLIIGAVIGAEVGRKSATLAVTIRSATVNGIYATIIYLVTIVIVYMIMGYVLPQYASPYTVVLQGMAIPVVIFLLTLEVFAVLSHMRKVN